MMFENFKLWSTRNAIKSASVSVSDPKINALVSVVSWLGWGGALREKLGRQDAMPSVPLVEGSSNLGPDSALQISAVWACLDLISHVVASLPFFTYYEGSDGNKELARTSRLYGVLKESPNSRMTAYEFWVAMVLNLELRGNAYARLDRDPISKEVIAMWPMPSDQVEPYVLSNGDMAYAYRLGNDLAILDESNVLHIKGMGNGTIGLSKLDFMRSTTDIAAKAQQTASRLFGTNGKPTGVLMLDHVLKPDQRLAVEKNFSDMATGGIGRIHLLEANMKYQQLSLSPEDQQLMDARRFDIEEICRWFGVPPVLIGHANVTSWGSGIEQLMEGFYKLKIASLLENIKQSVRKRVFTAAQRARMASEHSLDALLRSSLKDRMEIYAKAVQNGIKTRNEIRKLENDEPLPDGNELTAQSNLVPLALLGKVGSGGTITKDPIAQ